MSTFEVAVPIHGWQVYIIEAEDEASAKESIANDPPDTDEFDEIEWDTDTNNWDVMEV